MPGRFFLTCSVAQVAAALEIVAGDLTDEGPRNNIQPGQEILVLTAGGLTRMRWGMIPVGRVNARGRPVMETIINARSETVFDKSAFEGVGHAVVPVEGWYEWTGEKRRKTAWRIRPEGGGLLLFAAITDIWKAPGGTRVSQVATVTCEPNGDVREIHHRMGVILSPQDVPTWLHGGEDARRRLCRPWPDGRLIVEQAADVDWNAP